MKSAVVIFGMKRDWMIEIRGEMAEAPAHRRKGRLTRSTPTI